MATSGSTASGRLRALTVARVRGIPIRIHWTLVLALPLFAWLMANAYFGGTTATGWLWGAALAAGLFLSVTIHELAHSLVALRRGVPIREIILLPIGGASIIEEPSRDPRVEFAIAIVGPLASLGLGALLLAAALLLRIPIAVPSTLPAPAAFLLSAAFLNIMLGLFNLLVPAFPMDGGRVLRAALATRVGMLRATQLAAALGRGTAVLMGLAGLLIGNILLILVAFFVWSGAKTEEQAVVVTTALDGYTLDDIMTREPATIPADATVAQALDIMLETKHLALPVTHDGRPVALLTAEQISRVAAAERPTVSVSAIAAPGVKTHEPREPAPDALQDVVTAGLVAVVDATGRLLGIVTPTDIARTVQLRMLAR